MGQNTLDDVRALALSRGEDPEAVNAALKDGHTLDEIANHFAPDQDSAIEAAAYGGAGAAAASALKSGIGGGHQLLHKLVQEASKPAPQVSPQVAPQAAPVVETPIAPIDIPKPPIVGEDLSGKELWNQKLTGTSGPGSQMDAESLAKNRGTMNAARDASGRMQGSTVSDQGFIIGPEERARRELLAKNRSMAHPAQIQNAANEAALQNEARMTTQLKAAKAAKDAEAASLSGKIKAVTTPIKNAANTVANIPGVKQVIPGVKQVGKAAQWVSDLPVIGHALAGAGVAGEAQDAYNRFQNDDYLGGTVSGLGALGSAASVFPAQPPWLRGAEAGLGMGAPLLNTGIDYVKKKFAEGGEVDTTLPPVSVTAKKPSPEEMRQYLATHDENTGEQKDAIKDYLSGKSNLSEAFTQAGKELSNFPKSNGPAKAPSYSDPDIQEALNWAPMGIGSVGKVRKLSEALAPHEDKYLGLTQSDNYGIHEGRMGGNRFPALQHEIPKQADDSVVWMNDTENHANAMADNSTFNGKPTVWSTYIGGPDQLKSNKSVFQEILDSHYGRDLSPEQYQKLNDRIASLTTGSGKDKRLVFPQAFDIRDKFATQELGADTFARRGALADMIGMGEGVGKTKSGIILPNYQNILNENRDPLTEGVGTSSIGSRLFTVDPKLSQHSPGVYHPDYEWPVYGEDLNTPFNFTPHSVLDWYDRQFNKVNKAGKTGVVPHGNSWFNYMKNPQYIDDKFLTKLQKHGYAEGGPVDSTLPPVSVSAPRPSQSEMKAYLATHDENTSAPKDALGDFFSGRTNLSQALSQAGHELTHFPKSTTPNKVPSLDDPEVQAAMAFAPMGLGVIKNVGGNWAPEAIKEYSNYLDPRGVNSSQVKNWYDTVLSKYIQNRMGTSEDEIRKLADQGITHTKSPVTSRNMEVVYGNRITEDFPKHGMASSPAGTAWENASDSALRTFPADYFSAQHFPWLNKLEPNTRLHSIDRYPEDLGFRNIGDMLESDISAGKLTPEQLSQMSVEKAVRRTHGRNQAQAAKTQAAQETLPTVRDYPNGYHWKDLTHEDPETMKGILKQEGDTMQNCVSGYDPQDMAETGTKLFSLRDPAGNPHANIEVTPDEMGGQRIKQIKGKQNIEPNDEYKPYTQDFGLNSIHGQPYSKIDDFENAGLLDVTNLKKYGIIPSGPLRDKVLGEVGRIHPTEISPTGGRVSSGQHGVRLNTDELLPNLLKDLPGNYVNEQQLLSHLQGKSPRPVEESYSNFYDQPTGMAGGGKVGAVKYGLSNDFAEGGFVQDLYNKIPLQVRTFGETALGSKSPITEANLSPEELDQLNNIITTARQKRSPLKKERDYFNSGAGSVNYGDYMGTPYAAEDLDLSGNAAIKNTLGQFTYKTLPDGSIQVVDKYDFADDRYPGMSANQSQSSRYANMNPLEKAWTVGKETVQPGGLNSLPSRLGNAYIGKSGRPVNINFKPKAKLLTHPAPPPEWDIE